MSQIDTLISDARGFASTTFTSAKTAIDHAASAIEGVGRIQMGGFTMPEIGTPGEYKAAVPPTLNAQEFHSPTAPHAPEAPEPIPDPLGGLTTAPRLSAKDPLIDVGKIVLPTQMATFNISAPQIDTVYQLPTSPALLSPIAPTIIEHDIPSAPQVLLPTFDAVKPAELGGAPTDYAERFTAAYREAAPSMVAALDGQLDAMLARYNPQYKTQMSAIEDKLTKYLAGGTALTPAVENAIYERSRDKVNAEYRRTRDAALTDAAKRGFSMPSGALFSALQQARQGGADNNARASTEIAVKMAEMEQQNMQFAVTTSTGLRTAVLSASISYHQNLISLNGQALDFAKSILNAMIEVYNTLVKAYQAKLEGYKAEAQVFEARIRGAMANVELFKAEIDALQAMTQLDVAKMGVYREQINANMALAQVYRTQIDAVVAKAGLEKLKLEMFASQVQAYSAQTQAKTAEWQGYSAAVGGEEAKARVYSTQIQAYTAEWGGYSAQVNAKSEQVRAVAMSNQAKATYAAAQVGAFSALVNAESTRVSSELNFQQQLIQEYAAANSAATAAANSATEAYKARGQLAVSAAGVSVNAIVSGAQLNLAQAKAVADTSMTAGSVYSNLAASALSGMNTLVVNSAQSVVAG